MATTRARTTVAGLVAAAGLLILAPPAEALSCEAHPDASPEAITFGDVELAGGEDFFTRHDVAVIGTATEVEGDAATRVWVTL